MLLQSLGAEPLSPNQPFADQVSWISALVEKVEARDDLQLVIRIHPREDANRREKIGSRHLEILREAFSGDYNNVRMVWPRDPVSSYDLMELADAGLSSWSSTGIEMARLGVPVVFAWNRFTPFPLGDVAGWGADPQSYMHGIDKALARGPSLPQIRYAMRWMNLRLLGNSVDLSKLVPEPHYLSLPPFRSPAGAKMIEKILIDGDTALSLNHRALTSTQDQVADGNEEDAILRGLRRCVWLLSVGRSPPKDYRLHYGNPEAPAGTEAAVWAEDGFTIFRTSEITIRRRSPMVLRLASLAAQNATTARDTNE